MFNTPFITAVAAGVIGIGLEILGAGVSSLVIKRIAYAGMLVTTSFATALLLILHPSLAAALAAIVTLYRLVNSLRVVAARMDERRLMRVSRRSSLHLLTYQVIALAIWVISERNHISNLTWLYGLMALACLTAFVMTVASIRNLRKTSTHQSDKYTPDMELPTVSVCIPARNETADLSACLASVLATDYPKLEVLVLDECSQDRTSEIIKGFAGRGVRFVKGEAPRSGWLAKNQAYEALAEAASGHLLLFCGVDVRFGKHAIRSLVASLSSRNKQMISVMPRALQAKNEAELIQPMRYWWELALPRQLFNRPPVLSTLWMIEKTELKKLGGFKAVDNSVIPEGFFARELTKNDGYSFMRASGKLDIHSTKSFQDQWRTATRLRYPQTRKRPEAVCLLTIAELVVLALPLGLFNTGFFIRLGWLWPLSGLATILLGAIHYRIVRSWNFTSYGTVMSLFPLAILIEIFLLNYSMYKYEFDEVNWRERNICIPVMQTIPELPKV